MVNCWIRHFSALAVCGLPVLGSVGASAQNRCEKRIRNAERSLHQAEERHGAHSRQAEKKRRHLEEVRASCRL